MNWVHIKHDNCDDGKGGYTGKNRISIGPYSRRAALDKATMLKVSHRTLHVFKSRHVVCIIKVEREPIEP